MKESMFDEMGNYIPDTPAGAWAVYIGHFPSPYGLHLKFGLSAAPVIRLWGVHCNSAFALESYSWAWVSDRKVAAAAERRVRDAYPEQRTRGEWFLFQRDKAAVDAEIRAMLADLAPKFTKLNWKAGVLADLQEHQNATERARRESRKKQRVDVLYEGPRPKRLFARS